MKAAGLWHNRLRSRRERDSSIVPKLWTALANRRMVLCCLLGFSSGLPLYVLVQLVPAWLRSEGVDLQSIGLLSLATLPYTWKFLWAPWMDAVVPNRLGRRRGWAIMSQLALLVALLAFAAIDPVGSLMSASVVCVLVGLFSATQDIVIDAYRREILPDHELGLGNSLAVNAYRISSLVPGSLALIMADHASWAVVHVTVATFMVVGIATSLWMPEPQAVASRPASMKEAVLDPLREFFGRLGGGRALLILAFMLLYKLGDNMATALSTPFYLDLGFSKSEVGTVVKGATLWASVVGGLLGGLWMVKIGIDRALWYFGAVQLASILGFAALARVGADVSVLFAVVSFEYLGVGLGTAAFVAFIARTTNPAYTATQFALLTSLTAVPRSVASASTGYLVEAMGWEQFFYLCAGVAAPGMLLLPWVAPWRRRDGDVELDADGSVLDAGRSGLDASTDSRTDSISGP